MMMCGKVRFFESDELIYLIRKQNQIRVVCHNLYQRVIIRLIHHFPGRVVRIIND
ncbi:hypothetical protein D3C80_1921700 [compost metagenome]